MRLSVAAAVLVCICAGAGPARSDGVPPIPAAVAIRELDSLFGTEGAKETPRTASLTAEGIREFVRLRMADDRFYVAMVRALYGFVSSDAISPLALTLKKDRDGRTEFYYLDSPCASTDRVRVRPWWSLDRPVWVCKDSYRPEIRSDSRSGPPRYCEYFNGNVGDVDARICRCGEHLINCARDAELATQVRAAMRDEVIRTVQHIVQRHRPLSEELVMNETVRSNLGDFFYARNRYFLTGRLAFPSVDSDQTPSLRRREPYFSGGLMTTPQLVYAYDNKRGQISFTWNDFLCTPLGSTSVHAKDMFGFQNDTLNIRTFDHIELASRHGCQDCHARLEYGIRAYLGFATSDTGQRYFPDQTFKGVTRLYVRNASDLRAEGPATAAWLGTAIGKQPEFKSCVVRKMEEWLYGGYPVARNVDEYLLDEFSHDEDLARLVENLAIARFVGLPESPPRKGAP